MFKGKAKIELKDVKTGRLDTICDKNIVTNALNLAINSNVEGLFYPVGGYNDSWDEKMLPICPNAIGGILLFSDAIEENINTVFADSTNPCIGYASNDVNASSETKRGSFNLNESKRLDKGYKFVWDFTTSQANGPISTIALTHKFGGVSYFGDEESSTSKFLRVNSVSTRSSDYHRYFNTAEMNFDENYFITISVMENSNIKIRKYRKCFTKLGLNYSLKEDSLEDLLETREITPSVFVKTDRGGHSYDFFDGKDGFFYGFWNTSNYSGDGLIKWIKINKADYSFTEGSWTIENATLNHIASNSTLESNYAKSSYSVLNKNYLYIRSYDGKGIYKININSPADVTLIELGFDGRFDISTYGSLSMFSVDDYIIAGNFYINSKDKVTRTKSERILYAASSKFFKYGVHLYGFGYYNSTIYKQLYLITPYLATINNLSSPVLKTADKTMKITYTLEEI